jgi:hypothetical protein
MRSRLFLLIPLAALAGCGPKPTPPEENPKPAQAVPSAPSDSDARETAKANLKAIGLALHKHESGYQLFPTASATADGKGLSWRVQILPHLGHMDLYQRFKMNEAWDSPHNKALLDQMPAVYASPDKPAEKGMTYLRGFVGPQAFFHSKPPESAVAAAVKTAVGRTMSSFTDGTANTLAVGEAAEAVAWTKPDELVCDGKTVPKLGGVFAGGFHAVLADADAVWFPEATPATTVLAALTIAGGEVIDLTAIKFPNGKPTQQLPSGPPEAIARQNLKNIGQALHDYESAFGQLPAASATLDGAGLSWRVQILQYMGPDEAAVYKKFHPYEPWDSPHNKALIDQMPAVYASPDKITQRGYTHVRGFVGPSAFFHSSPPSGGAVPVDYGVVKNAKPGDTRPSTRTQATTPITNLGTPEAAGPKVKIPRGRTLISILDGTSNTLIVAEAADPVIWTKPDELKYDGTGMKKAPLPKLGGVTAGGFHALLGDGRAVWFPDGTPDDTLRATITIDGGEVVKLPWENMPSKK